MLNICPEMTATIEIERRNRAAASSHGGDSGELAPGVEVSDDRTAPAPPPTRTQRAVPAARWVRDRHRVQEPAIRLERAVTAQRLHRQRRLEPALTGVSVGTPMDLEGPQRATMRPTRTPSGPEPANCRRTTSLEGPSASIRTARAHAAAPVRAASNATGGSEAG